jgi:hypothetical protein
MLLERNERQRIGLKARTIDKMWRRKKENIPKEERLAPLFRGSIVASIIRHQDILTGDLTS